MAERFKSSRTLRLAVAAGCMALSLTFAGPAAARIPAYAALTLNAAAALLEAADSSPDDGTIVIQITYVCTDDGLCGQTS